MKKNIFLLILILIFCGAIQITRAQSKSVKSRKTTVQKNASQQYDCLPNGVNLDLVVSAKIKTSGLNGAIERETVKQRLNKVAGRCQSGKLVDGRNKEIRFYRLQGCWGNPPADYQEILSAQQKELAELKKKYTVIEITCNPSGEMPY